MFESLNPTRLARQFLSSDTLVMVLRVRDFVLVDINAAGLELTHLKREDVLGKRPGSIGVWTDPAQRATITSMLKQGRNLVNMPVAFKTHAADFSDGILNTLVLILAVKPMFSRWCKTFELTRVARNRWPGFSLKHARFLCLRLLACTAYRLG